MSTITELLEQHSLSHWSRAVLTAETTLGSAVVLYRGTDTDSIKLDISGGFNEELEKSGNSNITFSSL